MNKAALNLAKHLENENVRKFLDLIAAAEGVQHGYRTGFGNTEIEDLSDHPRELKSFTQTDGKKNLTSAAGRYQFIRPTWDALAKKLDLEDFGEQAQDIGALELIRGRRALDDVLEGRFEEAIKKVGAEWASLPSSPYKQNKRSWDWVNKTLEDISETSPAPATMVANADVVELPSEVVPPTVDTSDPVQMAIAAYQESQSRPVELPPLPEQSDIVEPNEADPYTIKVLEQLFASYAQPQEDVNPLLGIPDEPLVEEETPSSEWMEQLAQMAAEDKARSTIAAEGLAVAPEDMSAQRIASEADQARAKAISAFFGEDFVEQIPLPPAIDQYITNLVAKL